MTFDVKTLEALRGEKGPDEGKVFNLVRGLQTEIDDDPVPNHERLFKALMTAYVPNWRTMHADDSLCLLS